MSIRTFTDFPRNEQGLVDNFIGTAYDVVKRVGDNIPELQRLDAVLTDIRNLAPIIAGEAVEAAMVPARVEINALIQEASNYVQDASGFADQAAASAAAAQASAEAAAGSTNLLRAELINPAQGGRLVAFTPTGDGAVPRDVDAKLKEFVTLSDYGSLRQALATGAMVNIPATVSAITLSAEDSPYVLPLLYKVNPGGDLTINLAAGVHATPAGDIARIGVRNSTIKMNGPVPQETKASSVASITGTAGNWQITYNLLSASGAQVGDFAKIFDVGPLPLLNGDNAASYILREYPQLGELSCPPSYNIGAVTIVAGSNVATFASLGAGKAVSNFMKVGDLLTILGQTLEIQSTSGLTANMVGNWSKSLTGQITYYVSRPCNGSISTGGVSSTTINGSGSNFLSQGNPGDVLLVGGVLTKILTITSDLLATVDCPVTLTAGTKYSILQSAAILHEGVHEITAVAGNNVTVLNRCTLKPPFNGVTVDEFKIIKTVLKQNGPGDGFVFDQNGSLREINNLVMSGPRSGSGIGILLQSRIPSETSSGGTSFGDVTQHGLRGTVLLGENVGVTNFLRGSMVGHGCSLNGRKMSVTNNTENGVWIMEGGFADLRRAQILGGSIGLAINAGGIAVVTEIRLCGTSNDGMRSDANATVYGESPMAVACGGMNFRIQDSTRLHLTDGVSLLSALSGFYLDNGSARIDRMVIGANAREGIEATESVDLRASLLWLSGTSGTVGSGYGLKMGSNCTFFGNLSAMVGNRTADVALPSTSANTSIVLTNCNYVTMTGVSRLNNPTANGSAIWDTAGVDTGTSVPVVGAASGSTGTSSAASCSWTRHKDRYEFDARATVNTLGDWAGYLTMTMPFSTPVITPFSGVNLTTGAAVSGYVTGNQARIYSVTGTFPVAAGGSIAIAGSARTS